MFGKSLSVVGLSRSFMLFLSKDWLTIQCVFL
jgi:hypothetical protein